MTRTFVFVLCLSGLVAICGCCAQGLMDSPEPVTPVEITTPEPATPEPVSALEKLLSAGQIKSLEAVKGDLGAATTDVQFAAAYRQLQALADELREPLDAEYEKTNQTDLPRDLFTDYPFFEVTYEAEGTAVVIAMAFPPLREAAARTPKKSDDRFVDLVESMYENAAATGWSNIQSRNSDYSGCSPLGHGVHKGILLYADQALMESDIFATEIQAIRDPVIKDITVGSEDAFPYCDPNTFQKTLNPKIRGELNSILEEVKLSSSERTQLENAMNTRFAIKIGGGGGGGGGGPGPRGKRPGR